MNNYCIHLSVSSLAICHYLGCFLESHHAIRDDDEKIVLKVDENTTFAVTCTCSYDSSVMTSGVSWTLNGKTFQEKDTAKVTESQELLKNQSLVRGKIVMVADQSDSEKNLCCHLDQIFSCLSLLSRPKDDVKVDIDMSISRRSSGSSNWKIDVNCTVSTDNQQYRDETFVVLTISNGETVEPYLSIDTEGNHKYWGRRYHFHAAGRGKANVTCLRLPVGQDKRSVFVHKVFDPNLPEEYYIISEPVSTTTTTISPQQKQQTSSYTSATDIGQSNHKKDVMSNGVIAAVVVAILIVAGVLVLIIRRMACPSYCIQRSTSRENESKVVWGLF